MYGNWVSAEPPAPANQMPPPAGHNVNQVHHHNVQHNHPSGSLATHMNNIHIRGSVESLDRQRSHSGSSSGHVEPNPRQRSDSVESAKSDTSNRSNTSATGRYFVPAGTAGVQGGTAGVQGGTAGSPSGGHYPSSSSPLASHHATIGSPNIGYGSHYVSSPLAMGGHHTTHQPQYTAATSIYMNQPQANMPQHYPGYPSITYNPHTSSSVSHGPSSPKATTRTGPPERPPPPKFSSCGINVKYPSGASSTPTHQQPGGAVGQNHGSPSRPGNFHQKFPKNGTGSPFSSPSTPSPQRQFAGGNSGASSGSTTPQGGRPSYTPPHHHVTFSPTTGQPTHPTSGYPTFSPTSSQAPSRLPTITQQPLQTQANYTSQVQRFIQAAPVQTSPGNPSLGYLHHQQTSESGGSTPTHGHGSLMLVHMTPDGTLVPISDLSGANLSGFPLQRQGSDPSQPLSIIHRDPNTPGTEEPHIYTEGKSFCTISQSALILKLFLVNTSGTLLPFEIFRIKWN